MFDINPRFFVAADLRTLLSHTHAAKNHIRWRFLSLSQSPESLTPRVHLCINLSALSRRSIKA
jgi:hypothetical protein